MVAPFSPELVDRVAALAAQRLTSTKIAAEVGMHADNVRKLCQRYGIKLNRVPVNKVELSDPDIVDRVREAVLSGMSTAEICATVGISTSALLRIRLEYKIASPREARVLSRNQVARLMQRGMSTIEIAAELGTTRDRVAKAQRRFGLYYTDEQRRMIRTRAGQKNPNTCGPTRGPVEVTPREVSTISAADKQWREKCAEGSLALLQAQLRAGIHWLPSVAQAA